MGEGKVCGQCDEIVPDGSLACPKCGGGVFRSEKSHNWADGLRKVDRITDLARRKQQRVLLGLWLRFVFAFIAFVGFLFWGMASGALWDALRFFESPIGIKPK